MTSSPNTSSSTGSTAAAPPPTRVPAWVGDRWVQGTVAGIFTLVPVRRYPEWLRQAAMWVPAVAATTALVTPRVWEAMAEAGKRPLDEQQDLMLDEQESDEPMHDEAEPDEEEQVLGPQGDQLEAPKLFPTVPRRAARWAIGLTVGTSVYGYMRFALWLDGATEDKLRELGVARPRIAMAVLGGLATAATGQAPARPGVSPGSPRPQAESPRPR